MALRCLDGRISTSSMLLDTNGEVGGRRSFMQPLTEIDGRAYPLGLKNVDTDVIIPPII
jgi:hypothetical protein